MPDANLAAALGIPVEALPRISAGKRATYEALIRLGDLPWVSHHLGYIHWMPGMKIAPYVEVMRRGGVDPDSIYCDRGAGDFMERIAALKDCRAGDLFYVPNRRHLGEEGVKRVIQKGATIVEIDHAE